jgi:hypothetical protein
LIAVGSEVQRSVVSRNGERDAAREASRATLFVG